MFTGIIKEVGKIENVEDGTNSKVLTFSCTGLIKDLKPGDSVCVNGCCLTVKKLTADGFTADLSFSTIASTTFKNARINDPVNLEDSMKISDRFGGHFVTGHIDSTAEIIKIEKVGNSYSAEIKIDSNLIKFIAPRGSVAVDGISLTVVEASGDPAGCSFLTTIIPHTFENTILKFKKAKDSVNIEVDLLARYIQNLLQFSGNENENSPRQKDKILEEKLKEHGFFR